MNDLAIGQRRKFTTWLENAYKKDGKTKSQSDKKPIATITKSDITESQQSAENQRKDLQEAVLGIRKDIEVVLKALDAQGGPSFGDHLKTYRKWAHEVGRFSFRWHLKMDT